MFLIKVKIIDIFYNRDNNLFQILFKDIENEKQTQIAIKGNDWGITPDVPEDIVNKFCDDMRGQEKNLHIETEKSSLRDAQKDEKGFVSQEEINKTFKSLENYPIDEVMNILHDEVKQDEN